MKIFINGKENNIEKGSLNIFDLLDHLNIKFREIGLAVAVNKNVIPKSQYKDTFLKEGDEVEIVELVGGG